ncbi:MAG: hypothetical protein ACXAC7_23725 [Candidatus Hodarchaeales archaeon]
MNADVNTTKNLFKNYCVSTSNYQEIPYKNTQLDIISSPDNGCVTQPV